jgi:hypothetical protein
MRCFLLSLGVPCPCGSRNSMSLFLFSSTFFFFSLSAAYHGMGDALGVRHLEICTRNFCPVESHASTAQNHRLHRLVLAS